ncbi:putative MFS general substrate transporter [Lyophyllum shimeji]|uniref:MFS general substrate transporter n=1 Tax=Lyophyllum shimeji TaxID=47721 RepID=A0A9P3PD84_LYOSH|nr:putative MFS general substrate transporter [Lyophyllum shimeji]
MSNHPESSLGHEERPLLSRRPGLGEHGYDDTQAEPNYPNGLEPDQEFGGTEARAQLERSLVRKLDRRMSILILIYILNYIDRNNAAAARLRGFEEDLHLEGNQFASILSILYIGYIFMQIPSNMLLVYIGKPSVYVPSCMAIWGMISVLTGLTTNFFGALCTRFFLGFVEAAFFPGALFLIAKWYKRSELSQRTAFLYCGSLISNAFGSLLASGILDLMDGVFGYAAWRWLFFIEGSLTVFVAICSIFILPDFPESKSKWLTPAERALAVQRMMEDAGPELDSTDTADADPLEISKHAHDISQEGLRLVLTDWKVWWLAVALGIMTITVSFNAFFPTLSATMGYSGTISLLLCAPPWIFSTVVTVVVSRHSDRVGERYWHIVCPLLVGVLGFFLAMSTMNVAVRYLSLFLMAQAYAGYVCLLAWASGTISRPSSKRAVALAFINCGSTIGNIAGSYVWPASWGPTYSHSYALSFSITEPGGGEKGKRTEVSTIMETTSAQW